MTTTFDGREQRALAALYEHDQQVRDARPDAAVSEALARPGLSGAELFRTVAEGYADRPALGERATELVTDPATGRTSLRLLPRFDTISYRELGDRVDAVAAEWHHAGPGAVHEGDLVAVLGFGSVDYMTVDTACTRLGATVVSLQSSATVATLRPIVEETGPRVIASNTELLDTALDLAAGSTTVRRALVFDHHPEVDDDRERLEAARARLVELGGDVELVTLAEVLERGRALTPPPLPTPDPDRLSILLYTSGSTGTPKGAMYTERLIPWVWDGYFPRPDGQAVINVSYTPLSHALGRAMLFGALSRGGTVNFVAKSDLSTLFEDIALARPTELTMVPRICDMIFERFQSELDRRAAGTTDRAALEPAVRAEMREQFLGGRIVWAICGSAPLSAEMEEFMNSLLGVPLHDVYGSTEAGGVLSDHRLIRPQVLDYKLVDVPELGYFRTDSPHPRGELLLKAETLVPGYYKRPDTTAEVFDEDGYYRTGDIMAEVGPGELVYIDRGKNVLKLSQGEFVALTRLETLFETADPIRQIFVHGSSERSYLLAVVVPTPEALESVGGDPAVLKPRIAESIQRIVKETGLNSYEVPRDFLVETDPFTVENGLLTGMRKLSRPKLREHYGARLEALYAEHAERESSELRDLRRSGRERSVAETVIRAAQAVLGSATGDLSPDVHFMDLGGDSLSALSFSNLLREIFGVDVPVGVVISPANDLRALTAYIESVLESGAARPTFTTVHGEGSTVVRAADLTLDTFIDPTTLAVAKTLPRPSGTVRTVLLTGATGYLGRFLCLEWLERLAETGGTLVCIVRGSSPEAARARLEQAFDSGDAELLRHFRDLSASSLEVLAGDVGEPNLGLDEPTWRRLADTVDLIVHPAALVNHVLPYDQLFGPNVVGTVELIRMALTSRLKPFTYVSSVAVIAAQTSSPAEDPDIRETSPQRRLDASYANGYTTSKWAGEVLLRSAHDECGLPVATFRSDMILAHSRYRGQLNVPDMFTRLLFSLIVTGIAPPSFYRADAGERPTAHYDGLPVDFTAEAIATLGAATTEGYRTYNLVNGHDDGISLDVIVDWLNEAGHRIRRMDSYAGWFERFETVLRALPERQKQHSLLPLLHAFAEPERPAPVFPTDRFREAVRTAGVGPDKDVPHITEALIRKYAADLVQLDLL